MKPHSFMPLLTYSTLVQVSLLLPSIAMADTNSIVPSSPNNIPPTISQENRASLIKDRLNVYVNTDYYSWKGDDETKGNQTVTPLTITYRANNLDIGIRTAYINSQNKSPQREGEVSTMSDTNLSFGINHGINDDWSLRLNTDWNLPTGREALSGNQKNAIMDSALVQQTRFGEGMNTTAGFSLIKNLSPKSFVGLGYSHAWYGEYNQDLDNPTFEIDPGDENRVTLQGQLSDQTYMLVGGVNWVQSDRTKFAGQDYYRKGDKLDVNITGIKALKNGQQVTLGGRYITQDKDEYVNRITGRFEQESQNINGETYYLFGEYSKRFAPQHTAKVNASWLNIDANSYDQLNDLYNAGRTKWDIGVGYDYDITQGTRLTTGLKYFEVNDKATPATQRDTKYTGWNVSAGLAKQF